MSGDTGAPPSLALEAIRAAREGAGCEPVDADDAVSALRLALHAAHITLPDLRSDDCTCGLVSVGGLVELGSVRPDVALRLAEVVSFGSTPGAAATLGDGPSGAW